MALVLNGSGSITGVTDLATAGVALEDAALTDPVVTGGIYLGGTGAANYLDDYEEGTWTPTFSPQVGAYATLTYASQAGFYIKIGNMVWASCYIAVTSVSIGTASSDLYLSGLPFTQSAASQAYFSGAVSFSQNWSTNWPTSAFSLTGGTTSVKLRYRSSINGNDGDVNASNLINNSQIMMSIVYSI